MARDSNVDGDNRQINTFVIGFRRGGISHDALAGELERIACMLREGYVEGQLFSVQDYDGYWQSTEVVS